MKQRHKAVLKQSTDRNRPKGTCNLFLLVVLAADAAAAAVTVAVYPLLKRLLIYVGHYSN
eukprot:4783657-Amphidinium_carterae.2